MQEQNTPRFDMTINLGHVLTFVGFIATIFVSWSTLDKRVAILEQAAVLQHNIDTQQDQRLEKEIALMRASLGRIEDKLDTVRSKP